MIALTIPLFVFIGLLPSVAWLIFYIREDLRHPLPMKFILLAFILGGIMTFLVLPIQLALNKQLPLIGVETYSLISFLILGGVEEFFKFAAVYFFIHKRRAFDEPLHAMIYMITAALGFAAVENVASVFQAADSSLFNIAILEALVLRFVGATLLHSLTSGLVGYYWGLNFIKQGRSFVLHHERELRPLIKGLIIASLLHAVFNWLIIETGPATFAIVFLVFTAFFILNDFEKFKREDI